MGSHLVDRLMLEGHEVIALDNYFTGRKRNIQHWIGHPNFELVHHDVVNTYFTEGGRLSFSSDSGRMFSMFPSSHPSSFPPICTHHCFIQDTQSFPLSRVFVRRFIECKRSSLIH